MRKLIFQIILSFIFGLAYSQTTKQTSTNLFKKGEEVTCIYDGIWSWSNGEQFVKNTDIECKIINASEAFDDLEPNYQHIQVNCLKGLSEKWSNRPGMGMVKGHKLNYVVRWFNSNDCYHFVKGKNKGATK